MTGSLYTIHGWILIHVGLYTWLVSQYTLAGHYILVHRVQRFLLGTLNADGARRIS